MATQKLTRDDVAVLSTDIVTPAGAQQWHIRIGERHYIISAVDLDFGGFTIPDYRTAETMAFPADASGEVTDFGEVGFVPYKDHEACIADLLDSLNPAES